MFLSLWILLTYQGLHMETAAKSPEISFDLTMPRATNHYFDITMTISRYSKEYVDIVLPVWAPGSYKVRDFSRNIEQLSAMTLDGKPLRAEKTEKNIWRIYTNKVPDFKIMYDYYAFELSVRTSYLDTDHGYLNGSNLFFYVDGQKEVPYRLRIHLPDRWKNVSTGLPVEAAKKFAYIASTYDELADCPVEMGNHDIISFDVKGIPHEMAIYGFGQYNRTTLTEDVTKVIEQTAEIVGEIPYKKYVFIIHMLPNQGGGLEHMNSTTLGVDTWFFQDPEKYLNFLTLVAHEYFHLWNVKRLRPVALGPFDYTKENYTSLLWVSEGFTSYFDEQIVMRAGFMKPEKYLNRLESSLQNYLKVPGRLVQPLDASSFDTWIKFYITDENSQNATVSYYNKGSVVALLLDLEIMSRTDGKKRLDDVMRWLWTNTYKKNRGYTMEDLVRGCEEVAGGSWTSFFDQLVFSTAEIDFEKYLRHVGLTLISQASSQITLGIDMDNSSRENVMVRSVVRDGPAYQAGVSAGDEILAINGIRVSARTLNQRLQTYQAGDAVSLSISRNLKLFDLECVLTRDRPTYNLKSVDSPSDTQKRLHAAWTQ